MTDNYAALKELIARHPDSMAFGDFGEGVSQEWIERAEQRLGVRFPGSYAWWMRNYGGGEVHGDEIFSVYEMDFDIVTGGDVVYVNELNRKNGGVLHEITLLENDQGERYYFDLSKTRADGEAPVHVEPAGQLYADDFTDFLRKLIRE